MKIRTEINKIENRKKNKCRGQRLPVLRREMTTEGVLEVQLVLHHGRSDVSVLAVTSHYRTAWFCKMLPLWETGLREHGIPVSEFLQLHVTFQ